MVGGPSTPESVITAKSDNINPHLKKKGGNWAQERTRQIVGEHPAAARSSIKKKGGNWELEQARQEIRRLASAGAARGPAGKTR